MIHHLERVEFYITNVCNYNCEHCNRFNNYIFNGQQSWDDYGDVYTKWGEKLSISDISILGGEPLLNPSINKWIDGIKGIWKDTGLEIVTNGTRLNKVKNLYNTIRAHDSIFIHIGLHNREHLSSMISSVDEFMHGEITVRTKYPDNIDYMWQLEYSKLRNSDWPPCDTPRDFHDLPMEIKDICISNNFDSESFLMEHSVTDIIDTNGVSVEIHIEDIFHRSALKRDGFNFTVHDSNPHQAHSICFEKHNHHLIRGKLFKCNVTGVLPEFFKQFHMDLSDSDIELLNGYTPLEVTDNEEIFTNFIDGIKSPIPQCKFCPEWLDSFKLSPSNNKVKITKKRQ